MKVYLDNAASTMIDPLVSKAMLIDNYANPSSLHSFGKQAKLFLENSRKVIAKSINADTKEIYFTSGGTESNNLAIQGILSSTNKTHIITSAIEHLSILNICKHLEKKGYKVTYLPVNNEGYVSLEDLQRSINKNTALVTIMHANNELGTIQDIKLISKICKENKIQFHTDAVQSYKKIPINVKEISISSLSISSHKIHGPKGIGALYISKGTKISPLMFGGDQEYSLRPGTPNISAIVGFAKASQLPMNVKEISSMKEYFIKKIKKEIPQIKLNSPNISLCNIVSVSFNDVSSEILLEHLNYLGICASTGSACSSNKQELSHVLKAIKAEDSIRFSLSKFTTKQEIDYTIKHLKTIVLSLRGANGFNKRRNTEGNQK